MIIAAALCPWPPLLVRELTGADPVAADLREACAAAVGALLAARPDVVAVVGPASGTAAWPGDGRLNIAAFGGRPPHAGAPAAAPAGPRQAHRCRHRSGSAATFWTRPGTAGHDSCTR